MEKYAGNTWQEAAHSAIAYHVALDGEKEENTEIRGGIQTA